MSIFPTDVVQVGKASYSELNIVTFNNKTKLIIENYVPIAENVAFLLVGLDGKSPEEVEKLLAWFPKKS